MGRSASSILRSKSFPTNNLISFSKQSVFSKHHIFRDSTAARHICTHITHVMRNNLNWLSYVFRDLKSQMLRNKRKKKSNAPVLRVQNHKWRWVQVSNTQILIESSMEIFPTKTKFHRNQCIPTHPLLDDHLVIAQRVISKCFDLTPATNVRNLETYLPKTKTPNLAISPSQTIQTKPTTCRVTRKGADCSACASTHQQTPSDPYAIARIIINTCTRDSDAAKTSL